MDLAADGYAESGSTDSSAMALDKAARCLEDIDPEKAIEVFILSVISCLMLFFDLIVLTNFKLCYFSSFIRKE